jgi:hypothetical protein
MVMALPLGLARLCVGLVHDFCQALLHVLKLLCAKSLNRRPVVIREGQAIRFERYEVGNRKVKIIG